jgi:hypothetical protein
VHTTGPDAIGPQDTELAGFGLAGTGLPGAGPDVTETAPLAVPAGTLPLSFDSEISRLARLALTGDGELDGGALDATALDASASDGGAPDGAAPDKAVADNGVADISVADTSVADTWPPGLAAAVADPSGYRPPSHSRRRIQRAASEPASPAPGSPAPGRQPGVARGLLMTPWFAAASGFVIAASLWIYSSHPQLTFPIATGSVPCIPDGCSPQHVDRDGVGSLAMNSGQPMARQHKPAHPARKVIPGQARTAASGLSFRYVVRPAADGSFDLIVIVTGKHSVKDWHLAFVLPGDHIKFAVGADWRATSTDGGTASPLTGDQGQQHGGPWSHGGYGHGGALDQPGVIFRVVASGTPAGPAQCSFDGASCTFHELSGVSQGAR